MQPFKYLRVLDETAAVEAAKQANTKFVAGGTLLVDLMKLEVESPATLVDVSQLPINKIEDTGESVKIGAMARNSDVAHHDLVRATFPGLSEALLAGASPQLRNMATVGGNLLQRTRCTYFRDVAHDACNKRKPGSGCAAMGGWTRMHAVLGTSESCIAAHPSDMCVALVALDATVSVHGPGGIRQVPIADFHVVPGTTPDVETKVAAGELVTAVTIPKTALGKSIRYVKVRDRASYAFALVSCAAGFTLKNGTIDDARVALGGVATKPWRSAEAEKILLGQKPSKEAFRKAAEAAMAGAVTKKDNVFKVEMAKRAIVRTLGLVGGAS